MTQVALNHNKMHSEEKQARGLVNHHPGPADSHQTNVRKLSKKSGRTCLWTLKYPTSLDQTVRRKSGTCEPCQCYDSAAWRPPGNVLPTFSDHLGGLHILFSSSREKESETDREKEVGKAGSGAVCEPQIVRTLRKWGVVGLTHAFPGRRALGISHELGIWEPVSFSHVLHALNDFFIQSMGTPKAFITCSVICTSKDERKQPLQCMALSMHSN